MEAGWLLALVITPLFFNIYSSRVFEPDKITLLRSIALVVAAAWLIKLTAEGGAALRARWRSLATETAGPVEGFYRLPLMVPVLGLVAVYLISTLFSVSPHASLFGSYQRLQGTFTTFSYLLLAAAVAFNLRRRAQVERILTAVIITSLPISLYGYMQRVRLDPLPWGGDTVQRITANMGNAIFIAAYLIMAALVVLGRVVTNFRAILTEEDTAQLPRNVIRATGYVFIFAMNLVAIWFSFSRGPWLGLLAGLFFFFVILALYWRARWLALSAIGLSALMAVFLVALNIPNGPLEPLRDVPGLGRLGRVFETDEGTGRVRVLIWGGVVEMMTPHAPLEYPDGSTDRWNALRPFIGYGPESLYVAFNPFYPPELAQIEARNATPDRSHNETFDALAFTGLLGLAVHFALFVAVFYYSLKWLGLIGTQRRQWVFLALVLGGGVVSAIGFVVWQGPELFGVGLPFGMLLGLIAFLTLYALRGSREAETARLEPWRAITLISLFAGIVAHFTEIHFGIAIVSTRTHFWLYTALMVVVGYALPAGQTQAAGRETAGASAQSGAAVRSRRKARAAGSQQAQEKWSPILISGGLVAAVLITLGYNYITNPARTTQAGQILVASFTTLPQSGRTSLGILGLILGTWLIGGLLAAIEEEAMAHVRIKWENVAVSLAVAIGLGGISWLILSGHLAAAVRPTAPANTAEQIIQQVENSAAQVAATLAYYYVMMLMLLLGWSAALASEAPAPYTRSAASSASPLKGLAYLGLPLIALVMANALNLRVIQADIIYKTGLQFDTEGRPQLAIPLYQKAIDLAPGEDYYYLFLGRSYLNTTSVLTDTVQRETVLAQAERELQIAQQLNPLNPDHTANLGRLSRQWAQITSDPAIRAARAERSNQHYQRVVRLSRNSALLWNEWAALTFQLLEDPDSAQQKLDHSFALDDNYEQTYLIQGDLYSWQAGRAAEASAQQAGYQKAIAAYLAGLEVAERRNVTPTTLRINLAAAYVASNQLPLAIEQYVRVSELNDPGVSQWQLYRQIADLYRQLGDLPQARQYAELALSLAPEANKPEVQAYLDALQ